MSRKGPADFSVVPLDVAAARPQAPAELDALEAAIWDSIVTGSMAGAIDPAAAQLLRRLCAQAAVAERLEQKMRELRRRDADRGDELDAMVAQHAEATKLVQSLMASLRATPRSRTRTRNTEERQVPLVRPWDR